MSSCSEDPGRIDSFTIVFQLDVDGDAATCRPGVGRPPPLTCASYGLGCNARLAIRVLVPDEETEDPDDLRVHDEFCLGHEWAEDVTDICPLGDTQFLQFVRFDSVPPVQGEVEVTIWRDGLAVAGCPLVPYDLAGRPVPLGGADADLNPAFGRRVAFDFGGQDPVAEVPLACNAPQSLTDLSCEPPQMFDFEVHADNIDNLLPVEETLAQNLQVRVGQPTPVDALEDPDNYQIIAAQTVPLSLAGDASPFWQENDVVLEADWDFSIAEGKDICAIVTDTGAGSPPAATCTTITAEEAAHEEPVSVDGYLVTYDPTWLAIIDAVDITEFPSGGLILGRVVNTSLAPLDGVVVGADTKPLPPVIQYLNASLTDFRDGGGVPLTQTSASGYFVAQGADFRTTWDATRTTETGWRVVGTPTGGELNNRTLTILVIEMTRDFM